MPIRSTKPHDFPNMGDNRVFPSSTNMIPHRTIIDWLPMDRALTKAQKEGLPIYNRDRSRHYEADLPPYIEEIRGFLQHTINNKMLNSRELGKLLSANTHPQLFSSWLVMSPNGTLLAYSGQPNIKHLRDQAALLSQVWKEQKSKLRSTDTPRNHSFSELASSASTASSFITDGALETLTIESAKSNVIVRAVQRRMLLVLMGGSPPSRRADYFKITPEQRGDARYPIIVDEGPQKNDSPHDSPSSSMRNTPQPQSEDGGDQDLSASASYQVLSEGEKMQMLDLQRKKIDAATEFLRDEFMAKGFSMPDESIIP